MHTEKDGSHKDVGVDNEVAFTRLVGVSDRLRRTSYEGMTGVEKDECQAIEAELYEQLHQGLPVLARRLSDPEKQRDAFGALWTLGYLYQYLPEAEQAQGVIESQLNQLRPITQTSRANEFLAYLLTCPNRERYKEEVDNLIYGQSVEAVKLGQPVNLGPTWKYYQILPYYFLLQRIGFADSEALEVVTAWTSDLNDKSVVDTPAGSNAAWMVEVERQVPGLAASLFREYGWSCPSRYPTSVIKEMLDRQESERPGILVITSRQDSGGSFDNLPEIMHSLAEATEVARLPLVAIEYSSPRELVRIVKTVVKKWGKFSQIILNSHSHNGLIIKHEWPSYVKKIGKNFDPKWDKALMGRISQHKLVTTIIPQLLNALTTNGTVHLNTCDGSVMAEFLRGSGVTVSFPKAADSRMLGVSHEIVDGQLQLMPYHEELQIAKKSLDLVRRPTETVFARA